MKELKLQIINLLNEDVIGTSSPCLSVYGVCKVHENKIYTYQNGNKSVIKDGESFQYQNGIYHIDSDGNIIGVCPIWNNDDVYPNETDINNAHNGTGVTCFSKGTKITMSDGSTKNIEDIKYGDSVLTFNHETGEYEARGVYFIFKGEDKHKSFTLHFTNDIKLSIVGLHDLFEQESNKYVVIDEKNANSFVGKHFYNAIDKRFEELLSITYNEEPVEYYSVYTNISFNCIANNMLSVPDDVDEFLNIYEFKEGLVADKDALNSDIEKFGLFELSEIKSYTKEEYDNGRLKYCKIIVGRGLRTWEELFASRDEYLNGKNKA